MTKREKLMLIVERALGDPEMAALSDTQIADRVGCAHTLVSKVRRSLCTTAKSAPRIVIDRNGRKLDVSKIGRGGRVGSAGTPRS